MRASPEAVCAFRHVPGHRWTPPLRRPPRCPAGASGPLLRLVGAGQPATLRACPRWVWWDTPAAARRRLRGYSLASTIRWPAWHAWGAWICGRSAPRRCARASAWSPKTCTSSAPVCARTSPSSTTACWTPWVWPAGCGICRAGWTPRWGPAAPDSPPGRPRCWPVHASRWATPTW